MAASLSATHCQPFPGGGFFLFFQVVLSGSYSAGGETLDFTSLSTPPIHGRPLWVSIEGQNGYAYPYQLGATAANGKMMVRIEQTIGTNTPLGEHTAVAYGVGVTGDTIRGVAFLK